MPRKKRTKPATKGIRLSETQKKYAKMVQGIEADLTKKKASIEALDKQLTKLRDQKTQLENERQNLEGAKRNLENILSQIPPPPEWLNFQKQVHEYHYHYHYHSCGCLTKPCIHHPNIYISPWWNYYGGGNYIYYPSWSQVSFTDAQAGQNLGLTSGGLPSGTFNIDSGSTLITGTVTNTPALPNGSVFYTNNAGFAGPGVNTVMLASSVSAGGDGTGGNAMSFTSNNGVQASITALQEIGFFDNGAPSVDGADLTVTDLAKAVK